MDDSRLVERIATELALWYGNGSADEWAVDMFTEAGKALAPLVRRAQAVAWKSAVDSMVYEDGTPVEIVSMVNPYLEESQ